MLLNGGIVFTGFVCNNLFVDSFNQGSTDVARSKAYVTIRLPVLLVGQMIIALLTVTGTVFITQATSPARSIPDSSEHRILERLAVVESKVDDLREELKIYRKGNVRP